MELSRQEYWSRLSPPPPGDLLDLEIKPGSPALQADSLSHQGSPKLIKGSNKIAGEKRKKNYFPHSIVMIQMDATVIGPLIHFGVKLGLGYARNRYVSNEGKPCGIDRFQNEYLGFRVYLGLKYITIFKTNAHIHLLA